MIDQVFSILANFEDLLWAYVGFPLMVIFGIYLTFKSGFAQLRKLPDSAKTFIGFFTLREKNSRGVHPLKVFFAGVGGCVGVGNVVGICSAVQIGGPGALFWIWVTAIFGMILKYAEVYLGIRFREPNKEGGYNGGPMYFLKRAFKTGFFPALTAFLLCIYGVEILQFSLVVHSVSYNWSIHPLVVTLILLVLVLFAGTGGVKRVGNISTAVVPVFVILYMGMGGWIILNNLNAVPEMIAMVFESAFSGHAAFGGFVGSTMLVTISQGIRRGCYTGDVGVGYASIINSETSVQMPEKQASLEFLGIFLDTFFICTTSVMLILITGVWQEPLEMDLLVQMALGQYFPYMTFFMPFFLFLLGYSTINAYFCAGLKCAEYLSPRRGKIVYSIYAAVALFAFSFVDVMQAQSVMAIAGGLLLVINLWGIFKLRDEISYDAVTTTYTQLSGVSVD
ncbi:putative D-alanine/glycine transport protein, sodium-dependent [Chlamydiales bacterium STE3]|nr:putative D-alanine/glycine transport protein, sodium-dependent [Chlamydiales bacterium STE3]